MEPPTIFPSVTNTKLVINWTIVIFAPNAIPIGIKNMFATLCWNPHNTNNIITVQHEANFDIISWDAVAIHTAKTTKILQSIAFKNIDAIVELTLASATAIAFVAASPVNVEE